MRVLELGSLLAGPLCARLLGDFGAEVIKIELPGAGDPLRRWGADDYQGRDLLWSIYARNKKCIALNLREPRGQEVLRRLVAKSDVIVENFRPGTLEGWGLGPEDLMAVSPDLILVRVSGFGQTGPYSSRAGFGSVAEAMGGIRYTTGYPDRRPTRTGVSLGDSLGALFGTVGALVSLFHRERTRASRKPNAPQAPSGQVVDVAIYESVFALMESLIPEFQLQGKIRERTGSVLPHVAPSNAYRCQDGVEVLIAANSDNPFRRLCGAMQMPELADDARFATHVARGEHQDELDAIIERWTIASGSEEILAEMDEAGVPSGKIYTAREIVADPQYQARGMIQDVPVDDPDEWNFPMPAPVPLLSRTPAAVKWIGPVSVGSHTREVLAEVLGISDAELDRLEQDGIV